jgi:hypothetical protein
MTQQEREDMQIVFEQFREKSMIPYPTNLGVSGKVFNSHDTYISNKAKNDIHYLGEIDN